MSLIVLHIFKSHHFHARYSVRGLKDGNIYDFRVAAVNRAGVGAYAECETPVEVREAMSEKIHIVC